MAGQDAPTRYLVQFDRLGRSGANRPAIEVAGDDPERIAADLTRIIAKRKYLSSRFFDVDVDLEAGKVWVEGGRFGTGRISRITIEEIGS